MKLWFLIQEWFKSSSYCDHLLWVPIWVSSVAWLHRWGVSKTWVWWDHWNNDHTLGLQPVLGWQEHIGQSDLWRCFQSSCAVATGWNKLSYLGTKNTILLIIGYFTPVWSRVRSSSHQSCDKRNVTILLWLDIRSWAQTWCNRFWHGKQSLFKLFTSVTFLRVYLYYLFMFNFTLQVNHIIYVYCFLNHFFYFFFH